MVDLFGGVTWAILRGHDISAQDQKQPHTYHKWREKQLGWENLISPYIPNTLHEPGVEDFFDELPRMAHFIWMIAWVSGSLIGNEISHVYHKSYLEEAMGQQECFHLHLPPFHDVSHLVMHLWEETLEGRFVADYLEQQWGIFMRRKKEGKGGNFSLSM